MPIKSILRAKYKIIGVSFCAFGLSACMIDGSSDYATNDYQRNSSQNTQMYPEGYENTSVYNTPNPRDETQHQVVVPESYHVGAYHSPTSPKDMDKSWVTSQNPQGYTIELATGEKASQVAGVLYKAPKNERMAEVQYQRGGKSYYEGLYGSYPTQEAAQQALNTLPDDVKQGAGIKTWSSVQSNVD